MKRKIALLMVVAMILGAVGALAQPVRNADGQFAISGTSLQDDSAVSLTVDEVQLLGTDADGNYLLYADQRFIKAAADGLSGLISFVDTSALKSIDEYEPMARGARGELVVPVQQGLQKLGYLYGSADGDFGAGTERAVIAFQTDMGLEATGELDALQQMLLASAGAEEFVIDASMDPKARFAAIADKVEGNLEPLYNSNMTLQYDAFEGTGFISDGAQITCDASGEADIDKAVFTLRYGFDVSETSSGKVTLTPVIKVDCLCARRPVMQNLLLKAGDARATLAAGALTNTLSGARSVESCTIALDDDALAVLASKDLQMRIEAKYQTFDIAVSAVEVFNIQKFCSLAEAL